MYGGAFLVAQPVENLPAMQETRVCSLGWEDPLEGITNYSSILALENPHGQRKLAGSHGVHRVAELDTTEQLSTSYSGHTNTHTISHSTYRDFYLFLDASLSRYLNTFQAFYEKEKLQFYMWGKFFFVVALFSLIPETRETAIYTSDFLRGTDVHLGKQKSEMFTIWNKISD